MAIYLYSMLVAAIVAACVNNCSAMTEEQKEKMKAFADECGSQHGFTIEQLAQWNQDKKTPDDTNKCFFACMFRKFGLLNDQGLFDVSTTLEHITAHVPEARKNDVTASVKACTSVNDQSVGDGTAGCDRAVLLFKCLREQKERLGADLS